MMCMFGTVEKVYTSLCLIDCDFFHVLSMSRIVGSRAAVSERITKCS